VPLPKQADSFVKTSPVSGGEVRLHGTIPGQLTVETQLLESFAGLVISVPVPALLFGETVIQPVECSFGIAQDPGHQFGHQVRRVLASCMLEQKLDLLVTGKMELLEFLQFDLPVRTCKHRERRLK